MRAERCEGLFRSFRRRAIRGMVRSDIRARAAMTISGQKTDRVLRDTTFERYRPETHFCAAGKILEQPKGYKNVYNHGVSEEKKLVEYWLSV